MLDLERHFRGGRAAVVSDDIRRVLGREPGDLDACLRALAPRLCVAAA